MGKRRRLVVLLHGLGIDGRVWGRGLLRRLRRAGMEPVVLTYPSTRWTITQHAAHVGDLLVSKGLMQQELSFVCHSLGGVVFLRCCELWPAMRVRQAVLVSSPVRGSRMAHWLEGSVWSSVARRFLGPAFVELAHRWRDQARWASPGGVKFPVDVVWGRRGFHALEPTSWVGRWVLPSSLWHDGVVCEDETVMAGVRSVHVFPYAHNQLLRKVSFHRTLLTLLGTTPDIAEKPSDDLRFV